MPRCIHLLPDTDAAGAENQALNLLRGLLDHGGLELELVYFAPGRLHERFVELGIPLRQIARRRRLVLDLRRRTRALRAAYAPDGPDILHTWLFEGNLVGLMAARRWPATRVVVSQRSGTMEREFPLRLRALKAVLPRADFAISNSQEGLVLLREDLRVAPDRFGITPQGVAPERVEPSVSPEEIRRRFGAADGGTLLVSVGRADDTKDFPTLFETLKRVRETRPDAQLLLVGPTEGEMKPLAGTLPDGVSAVGWQDHPADLVNAADVVVISSWSEGHSNVADEALLLGRPVATTDTGDHPAVVAECGGRVVPIRRPDRLAEAILELLADPPSPDLVRDAAASRLSVAQAVDYTLGVYQRLLRTDDRPLTAPRL